MPRPLLRPMILLLLAGACAPPQAAPGPSPASPIVRLAPPPAAGSSAAGASEPAEPDAVSVTALPPPPKLSIDGDLTEWGSLLPPRDADTSGPAPEERTSGGREPRGPLPSGPNPRGAASHAAVSITSDTLLIAAELSGDAREGIWLGLGSPAPELAPIGMFGRGGYVMPPSCEFEVYVEAGEVVQGNPNPPEVVAACKELIARHEKLLVTHEARFSRLFRIDREGVRRVHADGTLSRIEAAKHALKAGPKGASVEISLPLAAMPRLAAAPLEWLRLVARPAAAAAKPPELPLEQWVWVKLPAPVSFEPLGELRARTFALLRGKTFFPSGVSYHPSDPLHVESVSHAGDAMSLKAQEETLYTKARSFGDVEIGDVSARGRFLAIFHKGKLSELIPLEPELNLDRAGPTELRGMIERDGELHVFWFTPKFYSYDVAFVEPVWSVLAVAPDGSVRGDVLDSDIEGVRWEEDASAFQSKELDTFGIRGTTHFPEGWGGDYQEKLTGKEITWRWDSKARKYKGKLSTIPVPAKPKKKK